jgi:hypothetical protein
MRCRNEEKFLCVLSTREKSFFSFFSLMTSAPCDSSPLSVSSDTTLGDSCQFEEISREITQMIDNDDDYRSVGSLSSTTHATSISGLIDMMLAAMNYHVPILEPVFVQLGCCGRRWWSKKAPNGKLFNSKCKSCRKNGSLIDQSDATGYGMFKCKCGWMWGHNEPSCRVGITMMLCKNHEHCDAVVSAGFVGPRHQLVAFMNYTYLLRQVIKLRAFAADALVGYTPVLFIRSQIQ